VATRGARYIGAGLNVYDPAIGEWRQLFSDNRPGVTLMNGTIADDTVVYRWEVVDARGKRVRKRYTLSRLGDGVRQLMERSENGGTTWIAEGDRRDHRAKG
jgi:hypothetical protein